MMKGAVISDCKRYRYRLWRIWNGSQSRLVFVMLNPSTADGEQDDPTIRKCVGFAERLGYGGIEVVNLFAWRATDPRRATRDSTCTRPRRIGASRDRAARPDRLRSAISGQPNRRQCLTINPFQVRRFSYIVNLQVKH